MEKYGKITSMFQSPPTSTDSRRLDDGCSADLGSIETPGTSGPVLFDPRPEPSPSLPRWHREAEISGEPLMETPQPMTL